MRRERLFRVTPGGALLLGMLVFLLNGDELAALGAAVAVHEAGHLLALCGSGASVKTISLQATGPVLHCTALPSGAAAVFAALSGPAAGLAFWKLAVFRWTLAAEMSLVLSIVNLLPVLPLDGGRALLALVGSLPFGNTLARILRLSVIAALAAVGAVCFERGYGAAPLLLAVWLLAAPSRLTGL